MRSKIYTFRFLQAQSLDYIRQHFTIISQPGVKILSNDGLNAAKKVRNSGYIVNVVRTGPGHGFSSRPYEG